jgi:hypothetical protein
MHHPRPSTTPLSPPRLPFSQTQVRVREAPLVEPVMDMLRVAPGSTLRCLDLSYNKLGDAGVRHVGSCLRAPAFEMLQVGWGGVITRF